MSPQKTTAIINRFPPAVLLFFSLTIFCLLGLSAQAERPFESETVSQLTANRLRIDLGLDYSHLNAREDLVAFPTLGINYYAGSLVELQAYYDFLYRFTRNGTTVYGSGDLTLWTKMRFLSESNSLPGLGLRFGVKLPNANDDNGLGTDQTDFYASILAGKRIGRFENRINLGIAILDDPFKQRGQQDMFTFAAASIISLSSRWQALADFYSQQGAEARFRYSKISAGVRHLTKEWIFDLALKKGLRSQDKGYRNELSLDWGIVMGVSRFFDLSRDK
ncbi:MAG: hypothetical protein A2Z27_05635 [candidate division Zixibacteria bacterium RBG_16_50_21]|nr:MAG: hypothetical protein A2Z27_05635 [candidate division Zixibacteria bacterium RBG_16_50_21]